ncbi:pentapeptide repeat-containing protein [Corynebacterium antarcticum]|uniref:pentapeptide repeat-containing protein n=1 Tax=Corynebacterium antarcticum TaxID=2800405 RepID=UPI00200410FE|nr:pentapeptide repeat-containing protein [Corynebacterium antarcticum]MCK7661778.1 pentapeptide repeat-containing protein [Corynebacterium antarcticum]
MDVDAPNATQSRGGFWSFSGIPEDLPVVIRGIIWLVAMLFRVALLPFRLVIWLLDRPHVRGEDEAKVPHKPADRGGAEPSEGVPRWRTLGDRQQIAAILVFITLPVALVGEGWGKLWVKLSEGPWWQWILIGLAVVAILLWLRVWFTDRVPEVTCETADERSGTAVSVRKVPFPELLFVLLAVLALAAGLRAILVSDLEKTVQLAAGFFAAGGVAFSVWATQRRSIEQQEREDRRQNDRLESESLRESRQLSVQQRMDMSKKLQTSIEHLANESEVVRAAAISELMFQIDDWNALIEGECAEVESRKPDDREQRMEQLKAEGLRRRQELFDLAMKDYVEGTQDSPGDSSSENAGKNAKRDLQEGIIAARRRGLKSAQKGSFDGVNFEGVRLPDLLVDGRPVSGDTGTIGKQIREKTWTAHLRGADLESAHLEGAMLQLANLEGAKLGGTNLEGVDLWRANLEEADLLRANLEGADLRDANLERTDLRTANLEEADLLRANLEGANLLGANLEGANLMGANLAGAKLRGANLGDAKLWRANLEEAKLWLAKLKGADLRDANLKGVKLLRANLEGAYLMGANLEGADLRDANLEGAELAYKNNDGALFLPCTFNEDTQWKGTTYSPSTVFPEGFDPEAHGMKLVDDPEPEETPEDDG